MPGIRAASSDADARGISEVSIAEQAGVEVALVRAWLDENNDIRVVVTSEGETRLVDALVRPDSGVQGAAEPRDVPANPGVLT